MRSPILRQGRIKSYHSSPFLSVLPLQAPLPPRPNANRGNIKSKRASLPQTYSWLPHLLHLPTPRTLSAPSSGITASCRVSRHPFGFFMSGRARRATPTVSSDTSKPSGCLGSPLDDEASSFSSILLVSLFRILPHLVSVVVLQGLSTAATCSERQGQASW